MDQGSLKTELSSRIDFVNKKVLRRLRKIASDGEIVTSTGRLFQTREAATTNARSPIVALPVAGKISASVEEVSRRRQDPRSARRCVEQVTKEPVPCKQQ